MGQRRALTGIALVHSGHSFSSGSSFARRASNALMGATTRKNTAAAMVTNAIRLLRKSPYWKWLWLIVNERAPKFDLPKISAMIGVRRSATSALTTAVKAVPITTATARSTTFPRSRNFLKSENRPRPREVSGFAAVDPELIRRDLP